MAHEIEIVDGKASHFYVGETPWHGLGTQLDNPPSVEEAIKLAGLDWEVQTKNLSCEGANGERIVSDHNAVVRMSDNAILGVVGDKYVPVQNSTAFAFFQPAVEAGLCSLETAGSLQNGKRIWALAKIADTTHDVVAGDPVNAYFLLSNSHDGTLAVKVGFTGIRVVCQNTLNLAHHNQKSKLISVRHTKNVKEGLARLQAVIDWQRNTFSGSVEQMRALARCGCDSKQLAEYIQEVFAPVIETREVKSPAASYAKLHTEILPLFEKGRGNDMPGVAGTYWGAYNAVSEYLTWNYGREDSNRLQSLWFGVNGQTNARAFEVAVKMAA